MLAMNFPQLLEAKYLEWRKNEGGKKTETEFAEWLGFKISTVSTWWNNKSKPNDEKIIRRLAQKLGDEVYDALGMERPDSRLVFINEHWQDASDELQRSVHEQLQKDIAKNEAQRTHRERKKASTK